MYRICIDEFRWITWKTSGVVAFDSRPGTKIATEHSFVANSQVKKATALALGYQCDNSLFQCRQYSPGRSDSERGAKNPQRLIIRKKKTQRIIISSFCRVWRHTLSIKWNFDKLQVFETFGTIHYHIHICKVFAKFFSSLFIKSSEFNIPIRPAKDSSTLKTIEMSDKDVFTTCKDFKTNKRIVFWEWSRWACPNSTWSKSLFSRWFEMKSSWQCGIMDVKTAFFYKGKPLDAHFT